jgi:hypothetical protein
MKAVSEAFQNPTKSLPQIAMGLDIPHRTLQAWVATNGGREKVVGPRKGFSTKRTLPNDPEFFPHLAITNTSQYRQNPPSAPRETISTATSSNNGPITWHLIELMAGTTRDMKVGQQLLECTVVGCVDKNPNSGTCKDFCNLFDKIFEKNNLCKTDYACHSLATHIHANRRSKELPKSYDGVGEILGIEPKSASIFRCDPEKNDRKHNSGIRKEGMNVFLSQHMDSHALPTVFLSWSEEDSYVHYSGRMDGDAGKYVDVGRLCIPRGLSLIYTTEIHTGSKNLNPYKLMHHSSSATDRLLFRIVHRTKGAHFFNLSQENVAEKLIESMEMIFMGNTENSIHALTP